MPFAKRILLATLLPLLPLFLFGIAFSTGFRNVAGDPQNVKDILDKSGVYNTVIPNLLANADKESGEGSVPLSDPAIKAAAEKTFNPQFVKQSTENIVDGTYAWLEGKADKPTFNIDLSGAKAAFAANVAQAAEARAATLPRCTAGNIPADFDALSASCLPPGVTPQLAGSRLQSEILSGEGFLENPRINADNLRSEGSNTSVFEDLNSVPQAYQQAKRAPLYLSLLAVLTAIGIVLLSPTRRTGVRRVGITLVIVGVLMLAFAWATSWGVNNKLLPNMKFDSELLAADIKRLIGDISGAVVNNYRLFGGAYTLLGAAAIAGAIFINRSKELRLATAEDPGAPLEDEDSQPKPAPKAAASKTRVRKIQ